MLESRRSKQNQPHRRRDLTGEKRREEYLHLSNLKESICLM